MNWRQHTVLVTGAGGFIGSHLLEQLVTGGANVRAFVRYSSRSPRQALVHLPSQIWSQVHFIRGDLRDEDAVRAAVAGCDTVFHLGALIAIPYSYQHPREVVETNLFGTLNVLLALREQGHGRLIQTSTSEVYGSARYLPIDENHPLQGQSPYAASKIGADKLVESFARSYGLEAVIVRPFNTYGPRQTARAIIPAIISQALRGQTLRLGSLTPERDFTYVDDTVRGFLAAALCPQAAGRVINLGSGHAISIRGLLALIGEVLGRPLEAEEDPARIRPAASEVDRLLADTTLARNLLGWQPEVSLRQGLQQTAAWIGDHPTWFMPTDYQI